MMLELLGILDGYRVTLNDALRNKEEKSRLEVAGGLGGACLWASMEWQDGPISLGSQAYSFMGYS